jgi:hypothetical protein
MDREKFSSSMLTYIKEMKKFVLSMRRRRKVQIIVTTMLSVTWVSCVIISLPPVSTQLNCFFAATYCFVGVLAIVAASLFLYWIDDDFFGSLRTTAPLGVVFLAIVGLFGYLISAEREARRPFLEKQLESCERLAEAAGTLPTSPRPSAYVDLTEWKKAWNRLSIFSDKTLGGIYNEFLCVHGNKHSMGNTHDDALCLARMCRVMVHSSWSIIPGLVREDPDREPICHELTNNARQLKCNPRTFGGTELLSDY